LIGVDALARGGNLVLAAAPDGLDLEATGEFAALSPETSAALSLATPVAALTSCSVRTDGSQTHRWREMDSNL
jgi:hypothetical protein